MTNYTIKTIFVNNYYEFLVFFAAAAAVVIMVMVMMVMTAIMFMLVFHKLNGLKLLPYLALDILNIFLP